MMGWLFYTDRRISTYADEKAEIARICTFETDECSTTLIKSTKVGSTWYAAVRSTNKSGAPVKDATYVTDEDGSITCGAVFLVKYDEGCFGYKDMSESAGPCEARAPLGLLDCLSELADPESDAQNWRKRCRAWAAIPTYQEGDHIRLAHPVTLSGGETCQDVTATHYLRRGRKRRCYRVNGSGTLARLSRETLQGSTLIKPAAANASPVLAEFFALQGK